MGKEKPRISAQPVIECALLWNGITHHQFAMICSTATSLMPAETMYVTANHSAEGRTLRGAHTMLCHIPNRLSICGVCNWRHCAAEHAAYIQLIHPRLPRSLSLLKEVLCANLSSNRQIQSTLLYTKTENNARKRRPQ
jgi:hypothetical protein